MSPAILYVIMTTYDRWYIIPAVDKASPSGGTRRTPKYVESEDIMGFAGIVVDESVVSDNYQALIDTNPDVNNWYLVRLYGVDNPGWQALNNISVKDDTRNLASNASDVAYIMNTHFPDLPDRTKQEWDQSFHVQ